MSSELHMAQNIGTSCERSPEYQALLWGGVVEAGNKGITETFRFFQSLSVFS